MSGTVTPAARRLLGQKLSDGWEVVEERFLDRQLATGGHFSAGYLVRRADGQVAFLKALDFSTALKAPDKALAIKGLIDAYIYERDLLKRCDGRRLSRVVKAVGSGAVTIDNTLDGTVQYLIFELADGDLRNHLQLQAQVDFAWNLRTLHQIGVGVQQLHLHGVAHQDLKPSNVFTFKEEGSKIGDLGSACEAGLLSPKEAYPHTGDYRYAPPEILYSAIPADWHQRRLGCDLYLFGSLITFMISGVNAAPALQGHLEPTHRRGNWKGTWADLLPFLQQAFAKFLDDFRTTIPTSVSNSIVPMVAALCEPDPRRRGHPKNLAMVGNHFGLERFISELNLLASQAEHGRLRGIL